MRRYRFPLAVLVLAVLFAGLSFGQGPLTNALNLMVRTDSNGSLYVYGVAAGAQGPLTNLGNIMLRTYSPGSLAVTVAGGTITPDAIVLDAANKDIHLYRSAAKTLKIDTDGVGGALTLINLVGTVNTQQIAPTLNATYSLGDASHLWAHVYGDEVTSNYLELNNVMLARSTAPTVTSAGSSPSVTAANGTAAFRVNVGTGGTATTIVMAMPAATTGWNCQVQNLTATAANRAAGDMVQQASTTTSVTAQYQTVATGAALAFTASDIVSFLCAAF